MIRIVEPSIGRQQIIASLRRDLYGPDLTDFAYHAEALETQPSRWYLTGFLVPRNAPEAQRVGDAEAEGDLDSADDAGEEAQEPDRGSPRRSFRPSSLGLSAFVPTSTRSIRATVTWGDYTLKQLGAAEDENGQVEMIWQRSHNSTSIPIGVSASGRTQVDVPGSAGLILEVLVRPTELGPETGARSALTVTVFLVNDRNAIEDNARADEAFVFQAHLALEYDAGFIERFSLHGLDADDWDERVADLHYRDVGEYAVGHNTSAEWTRLESGICTSVESCCMPLAPVNRVVPNLAIAGFELSMERLGAIKDSAEAAALLSGGVDAYRKWVAEQQTGLTVLSPGRRSVAQQLLNDAGLAANRIADGIVCLTRPEVLEAFTAANRAVARASKRRKIYFEAEPAEKVEPPAWRPFQLAFLLLNLRGMVDGTHHDREKVDLLFFPTGGGKTEAYLGLAAFAIAYRRIMNPGLTGAGLAVLMRYTLRLLTLDQLSRASAVVSALELERLADTKTPKRLGEWPIEIGLWVGRAATPNRMGRTGEQDPDHVTARLRVLDYEKNSKKPLPVPIRECPWCNTPFDKSSFQLIGADGKVNTSQPINLKLYCVNRDCDFHLAKRALPILTVDEPIYRRLPAFLVATVDKFAGMPWNGEIASFFGGVDRCDATGFYGQNDPGKGTPLPNALRPPDLIIQDELHLISGPLGTMVGLYEAAVDFLASRFSERTRVRPKIVVSTATVRRAASQVRALFDRRDTQIFPPPGPNRGDSFFAKALPVDDSGSRHYLGLAVPGGSPKVLFLRAAVSLMASAETLWKTGPATKDNPVDPYMTLLGYFNALRELGGARRIVEEEIGPRLRTYNRRLRVGETSAFLARDIKSQPLELTSRVSTDEVAEAKRRLSSPFLGRSDKDSVDVALATNMISVGLDITRLGLMLVSGQPKSAAEYIQTTSRVGRDPKRPGLVVVLLNVNKPRDRSHYERFANFHASFYRNVEATSVTPFSARALDRGLAAVTVALSRLALSTFTSNRGASEAQAKRGDLDVAAVALSDRAGSHKAFASAVDQSILEGDTRQHVARILDNWATIAKNAIDAGAAAAFGYTRDGGVAARLLYDILDRAELDKHRDMFRLPRSMRDVEPQVLVAIRTPTGTKLSEDA